MKRYNVAGGLTGAHAIESDTGGLVAFSEADKLVRALRVIREAAATATPRDDVMTCSAIVDMIDATFRSVGVK